VTRKIDPVRKILGDERVDIEVLAEARVVPSDREGPAYRRRPERRLVLFDTLRVSRAKLGIAPL
jgi:hypothetical protein